MRMYFVCANIWIYYISNLLELFKPALMNKVELTKILDFLEWLSALLTIHG